MSRKTYRPDDVCFLLRPEDVAAGIETVSYTHLTLPTKA